MPADTVNSQQEMAEDVAILTRKNKMLPSQNQNLGTTKVLCTIRKKQ